eukprot:m.83920 g.83920  ORF g.83920 m.83920 type:complete len:323 (+) comp14779_c0_seq3:449-1417(+)
MSFIKKLQSKSYQTFVLSVSQFTSGATVSNFQQTGKLTPDEFVLAGDFLVENFPTWSWSPGQEDKTRSFLPADKQMLITRNVPCLPLREEKIEEHMVGGTDGDEDDGWVSTGIAPSADDADLAAAVDELELTPEEPAAPASAPEEAAMDDDDYDDDDDVPDLDDFDYDEAAVEDEPDSAAVDAAVTGGAADAAADEGALLKTRTYDLSITYDTYYSTPRVWLFGYDADRNPLPAESWRKDFSKEHVDRTVTYEQHPNLGYSCPSIHPCKHAEAMQKMVSLVVGATGAQLDIKYYLLIFLKFIQAIIPNIEYDYTQTFQIKDA